MTRKKHLIAFISILLFSAVIVLAYASPAHAINTSAVSDILSKFILETAKWYKTIQKYALTLFYFCMVVEIFWLGVQIALNQKPIGEAFKEFTIVIITAGFFLAIIMNFYEWRDEIFQAARTSAGDITAKYNGVDAPLIAGLEVFGYVIDQVKKMTSISELGMVIVFFFCAIIMFVCFAMITAQSILIHCEFYIATMAGLILVGFGGTTFFRDYAKNMLRYVLSVSFKIFVLYLIMGIALSLIEDFTKIKDPTITDIAILVAVSIVILALVKSVPDICAGIINGSHVGSGLALSSAVGSVAGAALGAGAVLGGAAMGTGNTIQNLRDAANIANMEGKSGFGKLASMAGHMRGARQDAKTETEKSLGTRTRSAMQERLISMQQSQMTPKGQEQSRSNNQLR